MILSTQGDEVEVGAWSSGIYLHTKIEQRKTGTIHTYAVTHLVLPLEDAKKLQAQLAQAIKAHERLWK